MLLSSGLLQQQFQVSASQVEPICVHKGSEGKDEYDCSYEHYRSFLGNDGKTPSERGVTGVKQRVDGSDAERSAIQEIIRQVRIKRMVKYGMLSSRE